MNKKNPESGAVRYKNEFEEWIITNPNEPSYTTALMTADQYFSGSRWISITLRTPVND